MTKFTCTFYSNGDVLISGDFLEGHVDLGQPMLVDLPEANKNASQKGWLTYMLVKDFCCSLKLPKSDLKLSLQYAFNSEVLPGYNIQGLQFIGKRPNVYIVG